MSTTAEHEIPVLDLFAGPGGWSEGMKDLPISELGLELDLTAIATAEAAGHSRYHGDVSAINPQDLFLGASGLVGSPPCQGFSLGGKRVGKSEDREPLLESIRQVRTLSDVDGLIASLNGKLKDKRSILVLEPLRYALALMPSWIALEQVPTVLPIWEAIADVLRRIGYSVVTGKISSETFGVPQTRNRAYLVAKAPWMKHPARFPDPTHSKYHSHSPSRMDEGVKPWVSVAEALAPFTPVMANETDDPANTEWVYHRPSVTIVGSFRPEVLAGPGYRKPGDGPRQKAPGSVLITLKQASRLQSFREDYPWQGSVAKKWEQVGNAVPPLVAKAIIQEILKGE